MTIRVFVVLILCSIHLEANKNKLEHITCGSAIKLLNVDFNVRLHSHDVKYGSGSGQQSVTGTESLEDVNSHWVVNGKSKGSCNRGEPIACGDIITLQHSSTFKNLHSHLFKSPLSGEQEISCYGKDGVGDTGDNWRVVCSTKYWRRGEVIIFQHVDTNVYLSATKYTYGRPISGQYEIVGVRDKRSSGINWKSAEGIYIHMSEVEKLNVGKVTFAAQPDATEHDPSEL